jgi:hypothetical protein
MKKDYKESKKNYLKKVKIIQVKCKPNEYEIIKSKAEKLNLSIPKYLTISGLNNKSILKIKESKTDLESLAQLKKIGVNINQIAHKFNTYKGNISSNELEKNIQEILLKINDLIEKINS